MSICLGHRVRHSLPFRHSLASSHLNTGQNCETASYEPRAGQLCVCTPAVCAHLCALDSCVSVSQLCVHICVRWTAVGLYPNCMYTYESTWVLACVPVSTHGSQREMSQVGPHLPASKDRISLVGSSHQLLQASRLTSLQTVLLSPSLCFGWVYRCILLHLAFCVGSGDGTQASKLCGFY